jgi:hypothetical protein
VALREADAGREADEHKNSEYSTNVHDDYLQVQCSQEAVARRIAASGHFANGVGNGPIEP